MRLANVVFGVALVVTVVAVQGHCHSDEIDSDSLAILQRVIEVREADRDLTVELIRGKAGHDKQAYRIHSLGDKLRVDAFSGESIVGSEMLSTLLVLGNAAWGYRYEEGAELIKMTAARAESAGFLVITPTQIGLLYVHVPNGNLPELIFGRADKIWALREEVIDDVRAKVVMAERPEESWSSAVDPRTGRTLLRRQFFKQTMHVQLMAKYLPDSTPSWLPSTIQIWVSGKGSENWTEIRSTSRDPDPSLFELASLKILPGTIVKDMTPARQVGTWDGAEVHLEPSPNSQVVKPSANAGHVVQGGFRSYVGLMAGGALSLILAAFVYYSRRNLQPTQRG